MDRLWISFPSVFGNIQLIKMHGNMRKVNTAHSLTFSSAIHGSRKHQIKYDEPVFKYWYQLNFTSPQHLSLVTYFFLSVFFFRFEEHMYSINLIIAKVWMSDWKFRTVLYLYRYSSQWIGQFLAIGIFLQSKFYEKQWN